MLSLKDFNLKDFRWKSELVTAAAVFGVGYAGVSLWRRMQDRKIYEAKHKRIEAVRQDDANFRKELKSRLRDDPVKYQQVSDLPFEQLVAKLQSGELKALDALHAYQHAAFVATEKTNCVALFVKDAEERATKLDLLPASKRKPMHGVPVSMKECFLLDGTEATTGFGSLLGKFKNCGNGPLVQFLIDQGCVPFVKTNVPQGILSFDSRNPIYGITKNPHDLTRSPGGSSSGEGAILGAKASILGIGTDIGGSTRIPPSWCGAYSMKPTTQRMISDRGGAEVGSEGTNRIMPHDYGTYSFMARDSYTLYTVYRQFFSESTYAKNPEVVPLAFRDEIFSNKEPLTIGYYYTLDGTVESVAAMKRGVQLAKEALQKAGHRLVEFRPPNPRRALLLLCEAFMADGGVDTGELLANDIEVSYPNQHLVAATWPNWYRKWVAYWNRDVLGELPIETLFVMVSKTTPHEVNLTLRKIKDYRKEFLDAMAAANVDALLGPSFACPACHLDTPRDMFGAAAYTGLFNVLNWPAGIVPVTKVNEADQNAMANYPLVDATHRVIKDSLMSGTVGLPVAVQISGKPYAEEIVLRLMRDLDAKK